MKTTQSTQNWHVARWPALAWLETAIKVIAFYFGISAFAGALDNDLILPEGLRLAQVIVLALLSLGLLVAIADRLIEREIIALVFVLFNNLAHLGMLLALLAPGSAPAPLLVFAGLMLAGDLVKLVFLRVHQFRVRGAPPVAMYGLTAFYVLGYLALVALELLL